jgi:hypothetical protein
MRFCHLIYFLVETDVTRFVLFPFGNTVQSWHMFSPPPQTIYYHNIELILQNGTHAELISANGLHEWKVRRRVERAVFVSFLMLRSGGSADDGATGAAVP